MAVPTILLTPRYREAVIALLMAMMLALALLLGSFLLGMRTVHLMQLSLPVPAQWSVSQASSPAGPFSHLALIQAQSGSGVRLTVAQFKPQTVANLEQATEAAMVALLGNSTLEANVQQPVIAFRTGNLKGLRMELMTLISRRPWRSMFHELAVVTDDSGRYWAIAMERLSVDPASISGDQAIGTPLFKRICRELKTHPPTPRNVPQPSTAPTTHPS